MSQKMPQLRRAHVPDFRSVHRLRHASDRPFTARGTGKAAYEREQGRHWHALSMKYRSKAAKGLREDLLNDVPMVYGPTDAKVGEFHRKGMVGKNGGSLPRGVSETSHAKLPWERMLIFLLSLAMAYHIFFE